MLIVICSNACVDIDCCIIQENSQSHYVVLLDSSKLLPLSPCFIKIPNIYPSRNLPVFVKQIGFKRLHIDAIAQHELSLMKIARHPKLVEFIGLCLEPEGTFIVEGTDKKMLMGCIY